MTGAQVNRKLPTNVEIMPASQNWTPEQALAHCAQLDFKDVLIIGVQQDGTMSVRASRMNGQLAVFLAEHARLTAMGL